AAGIRYLLHRSIHHLLLDEFQDTSTLQWSVFRSMATEILSGQGLESDNHLPSSVFIVGDAKQSIYGFREAEALILDEAASYLSQRSAHSVNLSVSYRSSPLVLDFVNSVFSESMVDFPIHATAHDQNTGHSLVPGPASLSIAPLFSKTESSPDPVAAEAAFIAAWLSEAIQGENPKQIYDKNRRCQRPLLAGDCAILYRAATQASVYAEQLRAAGFAVRMESGQSFFERLEIRDLLSFCRILANPSDTLSLIEVLKSPLFNTADAEIVMALSMAPALLGQTLSERHQRMLQLLVERGSTQAGRLSNWLRQRSLLKPSQLIQDLMNSLDFDHCYREAFGAEEGVLAAANGARFADLVFELESSGLYDWYPLLDRFEQLASEESIAIAEVSSDAIQLMTIHKAKGLEFPLVVLVGTGEEWDKPERYWAKLKDSTQGTGLYYVGKKTEQPAHDTHMKAMHRHMQKEASAENLRLLYVALTRAQYHLLMTGHSRRAVARATESFHPLLSAAALRLNAELKLEAGLMLLAKFIPGTIDANLKAEVAERVIDARPWQLSRPAPETESEIRCLAPARLLEGARHQANDGVAFATEIGTFVHKGLEARVKGLVFDAQATWQSLRASHALSLFEESLPKAQAKLDFILSSSTWEGLFKTATACFAEVPIAYIKQDELIRGSIDLLLSYAHTIMYVIDYKTVDPGDTKDLQQFCRDKKYEQQLRLYVEGVRRLYPQSKVQGFILFTETAQLLELH
ncbi:MAG: UvrD-helicase domain-containing protein, partial [Proteobacteria bacterium]|nr:UvrD-helicase domain-containing protein [Pseudomonadota bacterium]